MIARVLRGQLGQFQSQAQSRVASLARVPLPKTGGGWPTSPRCLTGASRRGLGPLAIFRRLQLLPGRNYRQASKDDADHKWCLRTEHGPQLPSDPWKGQRDKAQRRGGQPIGNATQLLGHGSGDQRAERRFKQCAADAQQDPREGEAGEAQRREEYYARGQLQTDTEHNSGSLADLVNEPTSRKAREKPGYAKDSVQQANILFGEVCDVGEVDRHQFEGKLKRHISNTISNQNPGDHAACGGNHGHLPKRTDHRRTIFRLRRDITGRSATTCQDQEYEGGNRKAARGCKEQGLIPQFLRQQSAERRAKDPCRSSDRLRESKDASACAFPCRIGDVSIVGGNGQRRRDGQHRWSQESQLPTGGEGIGQICEAAGKTADPQCRQTPQAVGNPATENPQHEREYQGHGEKSPNLFDAGPHFSEVDGNLDHRHAARSFDENHGDKKEDQFFIELDGWLLIVHACCPDPLRLKFYEKQCSIFQANLGANRKKRLAKRSCIPEQLCHIDMLEASEKEHRGREVGLFLRTRTFSIISALQRSQS